MTFTKQVFQDIVLPINRLVYKVFCTATLRSSENDIKGTTVAGSSNKIWRLNDNLITVYLDGIILCSEHATCYKGRPLVTNELHPKGINAEKMGTDEVNAVQ